METTILVTVLATLGVVAMVTAIVVMFSKLNKKVDVIDFEKNIDNILKDRMDLEREINNRFNELSSDVYRTIEINYTSLHNDIDETNRFIDSRCDKLDNKIKELHKERSLITEQ
jgi:hypothetical protein